MFVLRLVIIYSRLLFSGRAGVGQETEFKNPGRNKAIILRLINSEGNFYLIYIRLVELRSEGKS